MRGFLILFVVSMNTFSFDKAIYGEDGRRDWYELGRREKIYTRSVAAMIHKDYFSVKKDYTEFVDPLPTLFNKRKICRDVTFHSQPVAAECTGFLIGEDLLLTAGHCTAHIEESCKKFSWIFSYNMVGEETLLRKVSKDAVYDCKEVITDKAQTRLDYAVVRLDRPVKGRSILKMNKSGGITIGEDVFTIGHPLGMPTKLVDDAVVTNVSSKYLFTTNLDTFMGNSGSPVFNSKGVVEGILVRGKRDFAEDYDRSIGVCHTLNRCDEDGRNCTEPSSSTGEEVVSLEVIFEDIKKDGFDLGI